VGSFYLATLAILMIKLLTLKTSSFSKYLPIYGAYLVFLAAGNNYASGGGLLIFYLLFVVFNQRIIAVSHDFQDNRCVRNPLFSHVNRRNWPAP
jgi:hypothetical protein